MKVFVVFGTTGEYSSHTEWAIHAYSSEDAAKEHVLHASERYRAWRAEYPDEWEVPADANEWDPNMQCDYTGTNYYYLTVELFDSLTKPTKQGEA